MADNDSNVQNVEDVFGQHDDMFEHFREQGYPAPPPPPFPPPAPGDIPFPDGRPAPIPPVPNPPVHHLMPTHRHPAPPPLPYRNPKDPYAHMGDIDNIAQMRTYILQQLGSPVICVELSEEQLNNCILDAVRYVQRYYMDVGSYKDYLMMELKKGITHYKICQELEQVVTFELTSWLASGINDLFTVSHNLLYNEMNSLNGWQFAGSCWGNNSSFGDVLGSWNATLTWLKELKNDFGPSFQVRYNNLEHELSVWPTPKHDVIGLMWVYRRQNAAKIFNNPIYRKLVVAMAGRVWANALSKYNLTLAGGGTLNATQLYSNYDKDYDWCLQRIDKESPNGYFFVG